MFVVNDHYRILFFPLKGGEGWFICMVLSSWVFVRILTPYFILPRVFSLYIFFLTLKKIREEREGGKKHLMRIHGPFSATGTATFPTHRFVYTPEHDPDTIIHRFVVKQYPDNIHVYDPYLVPGDAQQTEKNLRQALSIEERGRYNQWRNTLAFHEQYLAMTGRSYLANYLRAPPGHFMWRADYFGQEHWVATPQVQFHSLPPKDKMEPILTQPIARRRQYEESSNRSKKNRVLDEFRQEDSFLNLTLRVLSCAPRVFEIPNFLSEVEYSHIMELAKTLDLKLSSTGDVIKGEKSAVSEDSRRTRTSFNSWLARESSPVVDIIYRRAADLLRIDEALLRYRAPDEYPTLGTKYSIAESLQLVHYSHAQEYTAHHDFGFGRIDDQYQGARFATILFYLNDGMTGGETSFPRWVNAETFKDLKVKPEKGKAVLFYSQLPGA